VSPTESLSLGLPLGLPLWVSLTGSPTASLSLGLSHCVSLAASLAQALRRLGADLAKKDQLGRLPLHVAAGMGHTAAVTELVEVLRVPVQARATHTVSDTNCTTPSLTPTAPHRL
jgi:ankyrin repeat protein